MTQKIRKQVDYDREIGRIDDAIIACKRDFEDLLYKRHEVIAKKFGMDVFELIDYITKSNEVSPEAAEIIISIAAKKRKQSNL